jgi:SulP family sulfate permease
LRWGSYFRFVPYFVVAGFLAATGWFLFLGGVRIATGRMVALGDLTNGLSISGVTKLASAVAAFTIFLILPRWFRSPLATPTAIFAMWLAGICLLYTFGLSGAEHGWFLPSIGTLAHWSPLVAATELTWPVTAKVVPELVAVTIVSLFR